MTKLARTLFWAALVFAFVMAILPQPPQLPGEPTDKFQHMLAFGTLTLLLTAGYPRLALWRVVLVMAAFGAAIEVVQLIPALNRTGDVADWWADMGAVAVVLAPAALWRWRQRRQDQAIV